MTISISRLRTSLAVALFATTFASTFIGLRSLHAQELTGAGSTFINPIMTKWIDVYKKETGVSINYQPVGLGADINSLIDCTVDFA